MTARGGIAAGAAALLVLAVLLPAALRLPLLVDSDSYYHVAVAREYHRHGPLASLPWARLSVLGPGFGDKEYLFHRALGPFAGAADPERGAKLALALVWAALAGALAALAVRAVGPWGALTPLLLASTSLQFTHRLLPLRPESGALLLLLLATWAAGTRRHALLGAAAFLFPLSWTGFAVLPALVGLWFLLDLARGRRAPWRPLAWVAGGTAAGLLAHPNFPANLRVWKVQNVDFFRHKAMLAVGTEILPATPREVLVANAAWFALLGLLWLAARATARQPGGSLVRGRREDDLLFGRFASAALVFGAMALAMQRFALFAVPFVTLAALFHFRERGLGEPGRRLSFPGGAGAFAASVAVVAALGGLSTAGGVGEALRRNAVLLEGRREALASFGRAVPDGAAVAAPWTETGFYVFWAPQGRYLNVLDPVFLYAADPGAWRVQQDLFAGREPDVPLAALSGLSSRYVAFSPLFNESGAVYVRLRDDPRARLLHGGRDVLFELLPGANARFALDWRVVPDGEALPPAAQGAAWGVYPRASSEAGRGIEGFVDLGRLGVPEGGCVALTSASVPGAGEAGVLELAPWGPTELWIDGDFVARVPGSTWALLGRGVPIPASAVRRGATFTVKTCVAEGRGGFYLLWRPEGQAARREG